MHSTAAASLASGMMEEKASTTGSELRSLLDEGLQYRILLMEDAIQRASFDVLERWKHLRIAEKDSTLEKSEADW